MADSIDKLDSLEAFSIWWYGGTPFIVRGNTPSSNYSVHPYLYDWMVPGEMYGHMHQVPRPADWPKANPTDMFTSENFWLLREITRFNMSIYKPLIILKDLNAVAQRPDLWWHFPHQSLDDPTMIAYTPSYEYGIRDRQVKVKIGKYLQQFYGDLMSAEALRDLVNGSKALELEFAYGDDIIRVYEDGPSSCMSGKWSDEDHPVRAYTYQYPDGSNEFAVAYTKRASKITSRAIVSLKHKVYTRCYGDDYGTLDVLLKNAGYKLTGGMGKYGLRLKEIKRDDNSWFLPYLDSDDQYVQGPRTDEKGVGYFTWTTAGIPCSDSDGIIFHGDREDDDEDDELVTCGECDGTFHSEYTRFSEYHDCHLCTRCIDESFFTNVVSHDSTEDIVREELCVLCDSNDTYYLNDASVLRAYAIVQDNDGDYQEREECVELLGSNGYALTSFAVECGQDRFGDTAYCTLDMITPEYTIDEDGDIYHPDFQLEGIEVSPITSWDRYALAELLKVSVQSNFIQELYASADNQTDLPLGDFSPLHQLPQAVEQIERAT